MGPGGPVDPRALAGALESGGPTAGAAPPMPGGGAPGAPPPTPMGGMNDEMAMQVVSEHNLTPDNIGKVKEAIAYLEMKLGGGGAAPMPPMGPPGVA